VTDDWDDWADPGRATESQDSELEALAAFDERLDEERHAETDPADTPDDVDEEQCLMFTVTNPANTVSVTALTNGSPLRVDLGNTVTRLTEIELAEEISTVARLSCTNARAAQHLLVSHALQQNGVDPVTARSFASFELGLPTPEEALGEQSRVFASRYDDQDELD
jgi:hypothetical protein